MPFFDVDLELQLVCRRRLSVTVEAGSQAEARALAVAQVEADADWPEDSTVRFERGPATAHVLAEPTGADFMERSPEARFSARFGHRGLRPLAPRGMTSGGVAVWTDEAEQLVLEHCEGQDRTVISPTIFDLVAAFEAGAVPLQRHPGHFSEAGEVLARQMGCALLVGDGPIALLVRLSQRQCVGIVVASSEGPSNAPPLPDGWIDGAPYVGERYTHQGWLELGLSVTALARTAAQLGREPRAVADRVATEQQDD